MQRKLTDEHRNKLSEATKSHMSTRVISEESLAKMSSAALRRWSSVETELTKEVQHKLYEKYGNSFDYDKVTCTAYTNTVEIICNKHNVSCFSTVKVLLNDNQRNYPCSICEGEQIIEAIKNAHEAAGYDYDYSKTEFVSLSKPIIVTCKKHGDYEKMHSKHLNQGCKSCKLEEERFAISAKHIEKAKSLHNNLYDFTCTDKSVIFTRQDIEVVCTKHDLKLTTTYNKLFSKKLSTSICKHCEAEEIKNKLEKHFDSNNLSYEVDVDSFKNKSTPFVVVCKKHGDFSKRHNKHFEQICPECNAPVYKSKQELEVLDKVSKIEFAISGNKSVIGKELDIYVPSKNVAIEYNGLYWHSSEWKDSIYHLNKTNLCAKQDVQLIHIFEDEWLNKREIVESRIENILGSTKRKIYGRKCDIREISSNQASIFLEHNHIQGRATSKRRIGLFYENELVALMTFGNLRIVNGSKHKENTYELVRFCNVLNTTVIGGASKLLKHFVKTTENVESIISYSDKRWSTGSLYKSLSFEYVSTSTPSYAYVVNGRREHRFKYRKSELIKAGYPAELTEREIMQQRGIHRIYDCGADKWELKVK